VAHIVSDPFDDPQWLEYAQRARERLFPMLEDSRVALSIVPSQDASIDPKWCLELGAMIMLDKPIIAIVCRGARIPPKLAMIADEIVEGEIDDPDFKGRLMAAIARRT
jgi:hypothetical protein